MSETVKTVVYIVAALWPVVKLVLDAFGYAGILPDFPVITPAGGDLISAAVGSAGTLGLAKSEKLGK